MSTDYGDELVSMLGHIRTQAERDSASLTNPLGLDITAAFHELITRPDPVIIYFPPGHYSLGPSTDAMPHLCGPNVQLFFAVNALLRLEDHVTLIIQGSLRAGPHQIFGHSRYQKDDVQRALYPGHPDVHFAVTWPLGPSAGKVVFAGNLVPFVRPEWWGAVVELIQGEDRNPASADSFEALQAAIDAACTDRSPQAPLPIRLDGLYQTNRTLEVRAPRDSGGLGYRPVCLILRGNAGVRTISGTASIVRTRNIMLEVADRADSPAGATTDPMVLLRIHPGVDFDFDSVDLSVSESLPVPAPLLGRVESCVEVRCDALETSGRRGMMRRVSLNGTARHQLRIIEIGDSPARRHFVLDSCSLVSTDGSQGDREIQVEAGDGVMLHVSDTDTYTPRVERDQLVLASDTTLLLAGGSVLIEALLFHRATGPRPSTRLPSTTGADGRPDLDVPDGQDIFLDLPAAGRASTHFTAIQCESQSWWFLGRHSGTTRAHNTVLVAISHYNVNWQYAQYPMNVGPWHLFYDEYFMLGDVRNKINPEAARFLAWYREVPGLPTLNQDDFPETPVNERHARRPQSPPSLVWLGETGRCVLIGCRMGASVALDHPETIVDVATFFRDLSQDEHRRLFLAPSQILSRPAYRYPPRDSTMPDAGTFDGRVDHLVPILRDRMSIP